MVASRWYATLAVTISMVGIALPVGAELPDHRDHALPCRPTIACTADIVLPGSFEVEGGVLYRRNNRRGRQWTFPLLLKQTFTEALQLQVGSNGYSILSGDVPTQYQDDVVVGPKLHLLDQTRVVPALALSAQASIPTFRREGYLQTYDALFTGYATKDVGPVHVDLNAGMNLWRVEERPLPQAFAALALSMELLSPIGAMVEGYVFSDAAPVARRDGGLLFALSQSPKPWLIFDEGADVGFFPSTRAFSLFIGFTVIPAVLWRPVRP